MGPRLNVGIPYKVKNQWYLCRQNFPSKAGGVPAWLDPLNIPSGSSSLCDICGDPLQFLLQDQHGQRIRHPEETPSRSVKVFRCQLPRINPFYSTKRPQADDDLSQNPPGTEAALCDWCGTWKGDKLCSGCTQVRYCSEKHQDMSWRSGHGIACQQIKVSSPVCGPNKSGTTSLEHHKVGSNNAWPEFKILVDEIREYNRDMSEDNTSHDSLISRIRIDDTMSSHLDSFQDDDETSMLYFQESIASAPEQVLRYYRDNKARPIWPVSSGRASKADIPNCSYCGGPMCCEFQILPQLMYCFDVDPRSLYWATIVVYSCEASCEASLPYKQEYAWVQLYPYS